MVAVDDRSFVTFPLGTRTHSPRIGLFIAPLLAHVLAGKLAGRGVAAINTLDSYVYNREQYIPSFLSKFSWLTSAPPMIWHDAQNIPGLLSAITELDQRGLIEERKLEVLRSEDGRVEFLADAPTHDGARLYSKDSQGNLYGRIDGQALRRTNELALVFTFPGELRSPAVVPHQRRRQADDLLHRMAGRSFLISRRRSTGITYRGHNLDIDFVWLNYLSCFRDSQIQAIGSVHVMWHLVFASSLLQVINDNKRNVSLIITPYVKETSAFQPDQSITDLLDGRRASLFLLASLGWSRETCYWSPSLYHIVARASERRIERAWSEVLSPLANFDGACTYSLLRDAIFNVSRSTVLSMLG